MVVVRQSSNVGINEQKKESISSNSFNLFDSTLVGLDYIVENPDYIERLVSALESDNETFKKQVFELLSALCVYNREGYHRTFECLDYYKTKTGERYKYKFIIKELQNATSSEYQTTILAFINCLILSTHDIQERIRIRSEFIGLKLLHILHDLRNKKDSDLVVQLDVFDEQKENDESQVDTNTNDIDLSSPLEVFEAILRQIVDTPQEIPFLCILQHLLRVESKEAISDIIWDAAERLVHRATLLESKEEALQLFRTQSHAKSLSKPKGANAGDKCTCQCHQKAGEKDSTANTMSATSSLPVPCPEDPCENSSSNPIPSKSSPIPPPAPGQIPPPPPLSSPFQNGIAYPSLPKLPQQTIPTPKSKMRRVNWSKISRELVGNQDNLWATFAKTHSDTSISFDWGTLEGLFCIQNEKNTSPASPWKGQSKQGEWTIPKKEEKELILLDAKRSLNINIFLKQFRRSNEEIIMLIQNGSSEDFGSEKLRGLLKILPFKDEVEMLKSVAEGDKSKLASAEKFLVRLTEVNHYQLRIEAMLLKEELDPCVSTVDSSINSILEATQEIKNSVELQEVMFMILVAGNFLNSGGYAGDAAGLKLSSLQKLADIRGNKPGISLLHFIAAQAESKNPRLVTFVNDLPLEEASKVNIEQLKSDISSLKSKVFNINEQLERPNIPNEVVQQFGEFLKNAIMQVESLEKAFNDIEKTRLDLAHFFCEEISNFKLEECFKILFTFASAWKNAALQNERRRTLEKEGEARRLMREAQLKKRQQTSQQKSKDESLSLAVNSNDTDDLALLSPKRIKRRIDYNGNFSTLFSNDQTLLPSPEDITPNGSLRRRRNRPEDSANGLLDYLRASAEENFRERHGTGEQTGSFDRSLLRSSKRRPNLSELVNYSRERPPSTSSSNSDSSGHQTTQMETKDTSNSTNDLRERISTWFFDLENGTNTDSSKLKMNGNHIEHQKSVNELGPSRLDTLSEEENASKKRYASRSRSPSLKFNTDIPNPMESTEEVQEVTPDMQRRRSLVKFTTNQDANTNGKSSEMSKKSDTKNRRSFIGSLGSNSQSERLVLYLPPSATSKVFSRHGSTGEEEVFPESQSSQPKRNIFGTEEGFNRFASIRRSRKFKNVDVYSMPLKQSSNGDMTEHKSKVVESKPPNESPANKLKQLFSPGIQRTIVNSSLSRSFSRSSSLETSSSQPLRGSLILKTKTNSSRPVINEKEEDLEKSHNSLSERSRRIAPRSIPSKQAILVQPSRRGGFREGREAVSTRSLVAAQRALQQSIASDIAAIANGCPTTKNNSKTSLLSSRNSVSQNTIREGKSNNESPKSIAAVLRPLKRSTSATMDSVQLRNKRYSIANGDVKKVVPSRGIHHEASRRSEHERKASQSSNGSLNFMRPTASSSAKDKVDPANQVPPQKKATTQSSVKKPFR